MKRIVCKHGNPIGVEIDPSEFYEDGIGRPGYCITRATMLTCDECLREILIEAWFLNGQSRNENAAGG